MQGNAVKRKIKIRKEHINNTHMKHLKEHNTMALLQWSNKEKIAK
jgi:hypothetical protein